MLVNIDSKSLPLASSLTFAKISENSESQQTQFVIRCLLLEQPRPKVEFKIKTERQNHLSLQLDEFREGLNMARGDKQLRHKSILKSLFEEYVI